MRLLVAWAATSILLAPAALAQPAAPAAGQATDDAGEAMSDIFGLGTIRSDEPISIRSDELEATRNDGTRHLDFRGSVHVEQSDLKLRSDRLRALYKGGESQPERLVADGTVRVAQGDSTASCEHATYEVTNEKLLCRGAAKVDDGRNRMSGDTIEFDLARDRVVVKGGAHLVIHPEKDEEPGKGPAGKGNP